MHLAASAQGSSHGRALAAARLRRAEEPTNITVRRPLAAALLLGALVLLGTALALWKSTSLEAERRLAASAPEPLESVAAAPARDREYRPSTLAMGTVLALRSVRLRNELAGTVSRIELAPGAIVEPRALLLELDTSVERAELRAARARATLTQTALRRLQTALRGRGAAELDVERALAERDVARAEVARIEAVIELKELRAPFRARVGLHDVHIGQYLEAGTELTTLQGVDAAIHVDFAVPQRLAAGLREGDSVEVLTSAGEPLDAVIVAIDARVDPATHSASVRARLSRDALPADPGSAVRVRVPSGPLRLALAVPVTALRRGPEGDHVFVIERDAQRTRRARLRPVQSGPVLGEEVLIFSGLRTGEVVATAGSFKLREGVRVELAGIQWPAAPTPQSGT